jgi:hypothetical protein
MATTRRAQGPKSPRDAGSSAGEAPALPRLEASAPIGPVLAFLFTFDACGRSVLHFATAAGGGDGARHDVDRGFLARVNECWFLPKGFGTKRAVIRCCDPRDSVLAKAAIDSSLEDLRP